MSHMPAFGRRNHAHQVFDPYSHHAHHQVHDPFAHLNEVWDPFHEFYLETPRSLIAPAPSFHHAPATMAQIEYKETPEAHIFRANLHGYKKEEVTLQVEDDRVLKITGEKRMRKDDNHDNWNHYERSSGKFFTSFSLPMNSRADSVKSSMENGMLTITVPKKEITRNRHHIRTVEIR
ncbi:PREDICTED: 18.1 kDa class I heat shock protein-like [Nicotiana attenuata]|uniref:18.1 kDa class i heat shock protein n=1 Tax=Nicotiana attenuata TaxID=49451 RepID=A0A1J6J197_NICAT|nr:PREDICTED: 18.1 kDa class I heat shock protein-like [Nicotiana attenuata]OIT01081.1 18.1 kda class i heat shock protein [Nicotiana attenuata]